MPDFSLMAADKVEESVAIAGKKEKGEATERAKSRGDVRMGSGRGLPSRANGVVVPSSSGSRSGGSGAGPPLKDALVDAGRKKLEAYRKKKKEGGASRPRATGTIDAPPNREENEIAKSISAGNASAGSLSSIEDRSGSRLEENAPAPGTEQAPGTAQRAGGYDKTAWMAENGRIKELELMGNEDSIMRRPWVGQGGDGAASLDGEELATVSGRGTPSQKTMPSVWSATNLHNAASQGGNDRSPAEDGVRKMLHQSTDEHFDSSKLPTSLSRLSASAAMHGSVSVESYVPGHSTGAQLSSDMGGDVIRDGSAQERIMGNATTDTPFNHQALPTSKHEMRAMATSGTSSIVAEQRHDEKEWLHGRVGLMDAGRDVNDFPGSNTRPMFGLGLSSSSSSSSSQVLTQSSELSRLGTNHFSRPQGMAMSSGASLLNGSSSNVASRGQSGQVKGAGNSLSPSNATKIGLDRSGRRLDMDISAGSSFRTDDGKMIGMREPGRRHDDVESEDAKSWGEGRQMASRKVLSAPASREVSPGRAMGLLDAGLEGRITVHSREDVAYPEHHSSRTAVISPGARSSSVPSLNALAASLGESSKTFSSSSSPSSLGGNEVGTVAKPTFSSSPFSHLLPPLTGASRTTFSSSPAPSFSQPPLLSSSVITRGAASPSSPWKPLGSSLPSSASPTPDPVFPGVQTNVSSSAAPHSLKTSSSSLWPDFQSSGVPLASAFFAPSGSPSAILKRPPSPVPHPTLSTSSQIAKATSTSSVIPSGSMSLSASWQEDETARQLFSRDLDGGGIVSAQNTPQVSPPRENGVVKVSEMQRGEDASSLPSTKPSISNDFSSLEQHIEDLTQEKFTLQRALDAARSLSESLDKENSQLTNDFNSQGAVVAQLREDLNRQREELRAQKAVLSSLQAEKEKAIQEGGAATARGQAMANEVIQLEEKVLRLRSNELKLEHEFKRASSDLEAQRRQNVSLVADRTNLKTMVDALQEEKKVLLSKLRKATAASAENSRSRQPAADVRPVADASTCTDDLEMDVRIADAVAGPSDSAVAAEPSQETESMSVSQELKRSGAVDVGSSQPEDELLTLSSGTRLPVSKSVIPVEEVTLIESINSMLTELASERTNLKRMLDVEATAAAELRTANMELSRKLATQTQRLELAVSQSMARSGAIVPPVAQRTATQEIEVEPDHGLDEGDEVVERVLGWIMRFFPGNKGQRRASDKLQ